MESMGQHIVEVDALDVAFGPGVAQHEQLVGAVFDRACQTYGIHSFLIKFVFCQQIVEPRRLRVDYLQMIIYYSKEESTAVRCLINLDFSCSWARHNDLHLLDGKSRLLEIGSVLAKDRLTSIRISLVPIEE